MAFFTSECELVWIYLFFFGYQNTEVILSGHINDVQLLPDNWSINVCQHRTFSAHNLLADKTAFLADWRYLKKNYMLA